MLGVILMVALSFGPIVAMLKRFVFSSRRGNAPPAAGGIPLGLLHLAAGPLPAPAAAPVGGVPVGGAAPGGVPPVGAPAGGLPAGGAPAAGAPVVVAGAAGAPAGAAAATV